MWSNVAEVLVALLSNRRYVWVGIISLSHHTGVVQKWTDDGDLSKAVTYSAPRMSAAELELSKKTSQKLQAFVRCLHSNFSLYI